MTKQVVKIFTADQMKEGGYIYRDLETVINEFLKENPDHKIILTDYFCIYSNGWTDVKERALIVFEVSDSTSTGSGGRKKSKPKPKPSGKKPKREPREPTHWSEEAWEDQKAYGRSWEEPPRQRIRQ